MGMSSSNKKQLKSPINQEKIKSLLQTIQPLSSERSHTENNAESRYNRINSNIQLNQMQSYGTYQDINSQRIMIKKSSDQLGDSKSSIRKRMQIENAQSKGKVQENQKIEFYNIKTEEDQDEDFDIDIDNEESRIQNLTFEQDKLQKQSKQQQVPQNVVPQQQQPLEDNSRMPLYLKTQQSYGPGMLSPRMTTTMRMGANNTQQSNLFSSMNKTNLYTNRDSRHGQIDFLQKENTHLKSLVKQLKGEIQQIDEFRFAMEKSKNINQFQEKRIDLLKAQVAKQQRHIKNLTESIHMARKQQKQLNSLLQYLIDHSQEDKRQTLKQRQMLEQEMGSKTESQIQQKLDELANLGAIRKIQEYSSEFHVQKGKRKLKFMHPIKAFLKIYGMHFPVYTIFDAFPSQQKETVSNMLTVMKGMMRNSHRAFDKIKNFQLFKCNPYFFTQQNMIDIPDILIEEKQEFQDYLAARDQLKTISLDFQQLQKTESNLSILLEKLLAIQQEMTLQQITEKNEQGMDVINNLRTSIEDLLCLGIMISSDPQVTNSKLLVINHEIKQKIASFHNESYSESESKVKIRSDELTLNLKQDEQNYQQQYKKYEGLIYDKDQDCNNEFIEKYRGLLQIFEDMQRNIYSKEYEESSKCLNKIGSITYKIKQIFDMKNNMLLIKEAEIQFLKNQVHLYRQDTGLCREYVNEIQCEINAFLQPIQRQLEDIYLSFNQLFEHNNITDPKLRKDFTLMFKTTIKQIQINIQRVLEKEAHSNALNLKNIQSDFENKINLLDHKNDMITKLVQKETEQQQQQSQQQP